jgi:hypothetical protein
VPPANPAKGSSADRSWADTEYSRIYHVVVKRMGVDYDDVAFVGSWTKLLMAADAAYPTQAPLPRWLGDEMLERLIRSGLVRRVGTEAYAIAGMEKERASRNGGRRAGGLARIEKSNERDEHGRFVRSRPGDESEPSSKPSNAGLTRAHRGSPSISVAGPQQESSKPSNEPAISPAHQLETETYTTSVTSVRFHGTVGRLGVAREAEPPPASAEAPAASPPETSIEPARQLEIETSDPGPYPLPPWPAVVPTPMAPAPETLEEKRARRQAMVAEGMSPNDGRRRRLEAEIRELEPEELDVEDDLPASAWADDAPEQGMVL